MKQSSGLFEARLIKAGCKRFVPLYGIAWKELFVFFARGRRSREKEFCSRGHARLGGGWSVPELDFVYQLARLQLFAHAG